MSTPSFAELKFCTFCGCELIKGTTDIESYNPVTGSPVGIEYKICRVVSNRSFGGNASPFHRAYKNVDNTAVPYPYSWLWK